MRLLKKPQRQTAPGIELLLPTLAGKLNHAAKAIYLNWLSGGSSTKLVQARRPELALLPAAQATRARARLAHIARRLATDVATLRSTRDLLWHAAARPYQGRPGEAACSTPICTDVEAVPFSTSTYHKRATTP